MTTTSIEVSAQFGGGDAAQEILPHFRALKAATKGRVLTSLGFRELAFILRVDGEVSEYGQSGPGRVQFDEKRGYVSVDIGLTREDRGGGLAKTSAFVAAAIMSSSELLRALGDPRLKGVDWGELKTVLQGFADAYVAELAHP